MNLPFRVIGRVDGPLRRIAIVRALHLGDLLLAVPALSLLRRVFPEAEVTLIGLPWAEDFVRRFPYVDRLELFPGFDGMLEVEPDEARLREFLAAARDYRYDLALQMHGSGAASAAFTAALGARHSVGYEPADRVIRHLAFGLPYPEDIPEIYRNLRLVEALTGQRGETGLEFPLLDEDRLAAQRLLAEAGIGGDGRFIAIHPGARPPSRRWMPDRFAAVANRLGGELEAKIVLLGGQGEEEIARAVAKQIHIPKVDLAGRTTIGSLAAVLAKAALFVGNDSGPAHVAEALGVPSIALFGSADPRRWAPLNQLRHRVIYKNVECSPCGYWQCPIDHRCLTRIQVEEVLAVARELMREEKAA